MRYKKPFKLSYDKDSDSFQHYFIYLAALLMSVIIHKSFNPIDFLWSFSIWLEAFAILPQLNMIIKLKDVENITAYYIFFLGLYRIFYIIHW
jgi:ER lumen protein retaining receptor